MSIESDMTLLYLAARVDPTLRAACTRVDEELRALRESHDALVKAAKVAEETLERLGFGAFEPNETRGGDALIALRAALAIAEALGAVGAQG